MDFLESLAKNTQYSKEMQRYYLACIDEFGPDFRQFIEALITSEAHRHNADSG